MKLHTAPPRARADDAMLPLINVVFLLMVFFMLVGALSPPEAFELVPPRSNTLNPADAGGRSLIVAADGRLGLGREAFAQEQLAAHAATWLAQNPGAVLQVKADAAAEAQSVLEVLEVLQAAGITKVELLAAGTEAPSP
ncbi:MAG: ExbD/TolR family protein [Panacagrimonas sp.]